MWLNPFFKFMGRPRIRQETNTVETESNDKIGGKVLLLHLILNFVCLFVRMFFGCFFNRFLLKSFFLSFFFIYFVIICPVPGCSEMFRDVPGCSGMFRNVPCSGFVDAPSPCPPGKSSRVNVTQPTYVFFSFTHF